MDLARRLRADAQRADERRLLVLAGDPATTRDRALDALGTADIPPENTRYVGTDGAFPRERIDPGRTRALLGTTQGAVVLDCHDACRPNGLGRAAGAVDGGGLLILLTPPLEAWPDIRDDFDATLAVPPFERDQVIGYFRRRLVWTLRAHRGVAIVDVDAGTIEKDGIVDGPLRLPRTAPSPPESHQFPAAAYDACLTGDQTEAVAALERLRDGGEALVVEADRGRGKSSAAGLAAASLAVEGRDVLVTAPEYRNAGEAFARAVDLLTDLGELAGIGRESDPRRVETEAGRVRYERPTAAADLPGDPDCVIVDEAAALPVRLLERFLAAESVAFATTIHGYEGAGRGFSVRFRERLAESNHDVTDVRLDEPIRYAPGDPVEVWAFRALCLDARPAVEPLVADATPETVTYRRLSASDMVADEALLREVFGLLVFAHYRTEPDDLARMLDAPNVTARALLHDGHVVSVALLAREGGLPGELRARMYEGERIRGNMLPDVLTSQLRDEAAGEPVGYRVMRIATHHAARSRGLGSRLLEEVRAEVERRVDWLGVGYGATPELLEFWCKNGFRTVHLATSRNESSGEHSAIMLDPLSEAGERLHDRHAGWFCKRAPSVLADSLSELDPAVVRAGLCATGATPAIDLSTFEWRIAAGLPGGAAIFDTAPRAVRRLAFRHLVAPADPDALSPPQERLLVRKALQARPWDAVTEELGFQARSECMRALGTAVDALVKLYGDDRIRDDRERFG
ncbi:MAG: tRNA(Met) cytidine acetyltransferase TmcA [Haloarculaceae archaeon]